MVEKGIMAVKMPKVDIINHDEGWIDVYLDGKHAYGGHNIEAEMLLDLLGVGYVSRWVDEEQAEKLADTYPGLGMRA